MNQTASDTTEIRHVLGASGQLRLRNVSGAIRIVAVDGDEAVVRVTSSNGRAPQLNVERSAGELLVEPERGAGGIGFGIRIGNGGELDFEARVPRGAGIDVKTVSGDVDARGLLGEQRYKSVSGDIRLTAGAGRVSAMSVSGDVRLHDGDEVEFEGATTSGDVTVEGRLVWLIGVRTVSGDVRVAGRLQSGPRHSVETVSGDLILEPVGGVTIESKRALDFARKNRVPQVIGDGAAQLVFRSMSGEEHVRSRSAQTRDDAPPAGPLDDEPSHDLGAPPRAQADQGGSIDILRALERGEIDVEEAARRLEEVSHG
jgi:hypothetical protein